MTSIGSTSSSTFEQTIATKAIQTSPDPIHWTMETSYRSSTYRFLNHQKGQIGTFTIRLLEAKNLIRKHWSVLSLGPVKHLGLSKAHGEVTSFVQFQLGFVDSYLYFQKYKDTLPSAEEEEVASLYPYFIPAMDQNKNKRIYQSSTISSNSNPSWSNIQSSTNKSLFSIPLQKGSMPQDGMNILLQVIVKEERTAVDTFIPGITGLTKGGSMDGQIGIGYVDITNLLLKRDESLLSSTRGCSLTPHCHGDTDVWDLWIDLMYYEEAIMTTTTTITPDRSTTTAATSKGATGIKIPSSSSNTNNKTSSLDSKSTGQVRILISYEPHGLVPRQGDIVALESFARLRESTLSCHPIIPPFHPLKVLDIRGDFLLIQFDYYNSLRKNEDYDDDERKVKAYHKKSSSSFSRRGTVKIHRNSIFVIERTNVMDAVVNTALTPLDIALATPIGKGITHHSQPYVEAIGELLMPAILSTKLLWEACKLGGGATWMGVQTAASVILQSQDPENRRRVQKNTL